MSISGIFKHGGPRTITQDIIIIDGPTVPMELFTPIKLLPTIARSWRKNGLAISFPHHRMAVLWYTTEQITGQIAGFQQIMPATIPPTKRLHKMSTAMNGGTEIPSTHTTSIRM